MNLPDQPAATAWLSTLAYRLLREQAIILAQWQMRVDARNHTSELAKLSLAEFCDHIPDFLDRLCGVFLGEDPASPARLAARHGAHRWQHGASLKLVTQEWGLLHQVLMDHIAAAAAANSGPGVDAAMLRDAAYRLLVDEIHQAITASVEEFHARQRVEAEARLRDLEAVLDRRDQRGVRCGRQLHSVSHDLRGSVRLLQTSYALLEAGHGGAEALEAIGNAAENLDQLLRDLRDLARLEAGRETCHIDSFNAATLLDDLCGKLRPLAESKGLTLSAQGAASLPVSGDASKVRRIAQNLILNALKYTSAGEVHIGWESAAGQRWLFYVRDTGDLSASTAGALAGSLEEAETREDGVHPGVAPHLCDLPAPPHASESGIKPADGAGEVERHGEGIGLAIVHQLCELLDAVVEVESERDLGTVFRVLLPKRYAV